MKVSFKSVSIFLVILLPPASHAFPELPFCPAGGPPGWMNYFSDKRAQNNWRRYSSYYASPAYRPMPYYPPDYRQPPKYFPATYNNRQNFSPATYAPYRSR